MSSRRASCPERSPVRTVVRIAALAVALGIVGACGTRIEGPDEAVRIYVDAIAAGDWARAYRTLDPEAVDGMTLAEFRTYCADHEELVRARAVAIDHSLASGDLRIQASVPVDRVRAVDLVHDGSAWFLVDGIPPAPGADTPMDAMALLASTLESDQLGRLLTLLSDDLRARYIAEIDELVTVLAQSGASTLSVIGDSASMTVGDVTIRLVREDGSWRVSAIEQPYGMMGEFDYYEGW